MKRPKTLKILGIDISITERSRALEAIEVALNSRQRFFISTPNPEILVAAHKNSILRKVLNTANLSLPDGVGLNFATRMLGFPQLEIISGRSFMVDLLKIGEEKRLKIFFLGASKKVNEKLVKLVKINFPGVTLRGVSGPFLDSKGSPVDEKEMKENEQVISTVNKFAPDILFIAFGAPKQELWYWNYKDSLKTRVSMVVGGAFDSYTGEKPLPPPIFQKMGLEWLWRLVLDPKRIRRIFNAIIVFPLLILKSKYIDKNTLK